MSTADLEPDSNFGPARKPLPKNHHYVPRFYLAQFATVQAGEKTPGLWMFARGQSSPRRIPPVQIARIDQYYAYPFHGAHDASPEMWFGKIETYAARIFDRFNQNEYELTRGEKVAFSRFVGLMLIRMPAERLTIERGFAPKVDQFKERFPETLPRANGGVR